MTGQVAMAGGGAAAAAGCVVNDDGNTDDGKKLRRVVCTCCSCPPRVILSHTHTHTIFSSLLFLDLRSCAWETSLSLSSSSTLTESTTMPHVEKNAKF